MLSPRSLSMSTQSGNAAGSSSGSPDLDIDSDNTNAFGEPDRSQHEEDIEDNAQLTGKILMVNDGDTDGNGVPNFADGLATPQFNTHGGNGGKYVPLVLQIAKPFDDESVRIKFDYPASDPASITPQGTPPTVIYNLPDAGKLRIWKKDGNVNRDAAADFIKTGVDYKPSDLGYSEDNDTKTFYLEAVKASATVDELRIEVETFKLSEGGTRDSLGKDAVRVSAFGVELVQVTGDSETTKVSELDVSHSAPVVTLNTVATQSVVPSADGSRLLATVTLAGTVHSALCNTIPSADGRINQVKVFLNGNEFPVRTISTSSSKNSQNSFLSPFPFSASFQDTFQYEVGDGNNVFEVAAEDPSGVSGFAEGAVTIFPQHPIVALGNFLTIHPFSLNSGSLDSMHVKLLVRNSPNSQSTYEADLQETGSNTWVFERIEVGASMRVTILAPLPGSSPDEFFVRVTCQVPAGNILVIDEQFHMTRPIPPPETPPGNYEGANTRLAEDYEFLDWNPVLADGVLRSWAFDTEVALGNKSNSGPLNLYMLQLVGPEPVIQKIQHVETTAGNRVVRRAFDGNYYLFEDNTTASLIRFVPAANQITTVAEDVLDFVKGFAKGFLAGGVDMVVGLYTLGKFIVKEAFRLSPIGFVWVMTFGDRYASEKAFVAKTVGLAKQLADLYLKLIQDQNSILAAMLSGDLDEAKAISGPYVRAFEFCGELIGKLIDDFANASLERKGWVIGRATFEIVTLLVSFLKISHLSKLKFLNNLKQIPFFKTGEGAPAMQKIGDLMLDLQKATGDGMFEKMLSVHRHIRKTNPGKNAFDSLIEMKNLLKQQGGPAGLKRYAGEPWKKMFEDVNTEMFSKCAKGETGLADMPSYKQWQDEFTGLFGSKPANDLDINIHHAVETWIQKTEFLGITDTVAEANKVPGFVIRRAKHTGGKNRLAWDLDRAIKPLKGGNKIDITTKIKDVYLAQDPPLTDLWKVTKKWLDTKSIPTPPD